MSCDVEPGEVIAGAREAPYEQEREVMHIDGGGKCRKPSSVSTVLE